MLERFWAKVNKNGPTQAHMTTACWVWTACINEWGYGHFGVGRHSRGAHRLSWEWEHGHPPDGFVLHRCDTPSCVRPDHLYLGDAAQNVKDRENRGRTAKGEAVANRGEAAGTVTLTEAGVLAIRAARGETHQSLADRFSVRRETIGKILRRERWTHT